jgi:hypothetical protein
MLAPKFGCTKLSIAQAHPELGLDISFVPAQITR